MSNLTLVIDDDLLRAARIKAVQEGTSVNEICRQAIARYAAPAAGGSDFMTQLRSLALRNAQRHGAAGSRDEWMDEALAERLPAR
jgi:hypothetical protein